MKIEGFIDSMSGGILIGLMTLTLSLRSGNLKYLNGHYKFCLYNEILLREISDKFVSNGSLVLS